MCNSKECADYFKSKGGYHRCFVEMRKKWISYGDAALNGKVRITLEQPSEEERRAISGITGRSYGDAEPIRLLFSEFEQGLQKTKFAPVDMKELLETYFGESLLTNQERRKQEQEEKNTFFDGICRYFAERAGRESWVFLWISEMIGEKKYGYQLLMREYGRNKKQAEGLVRNVGQAIINLEELRWLEEECPLAVFAAEISGNPHYFDYGTAAGQLLVHAVCYCENTELPENAYQWRKLLTRVFIEPDNLSSMIHARGLRLRTEQGWHPAYEAFCRLREPSVITMENLKGITGVQTMGNRAYVVENEMVFSYLSDSLKTLDCTLLCTAGQPRSAAHTLIPHILAYGAEIYYSGDIDPDGICIADGLWRKFGEGIHIWRMSPLDYEKSLSKERTGADGRKKLAHVSHPVLKMTAECVKEKQLAGYQENILRELVGDIINSGLHHSRSK